MKIILASDHAGFWLKNEIATALNAKGYDVEDMGPTTLDPNDDYPDYIAPAAKRVSGDPENTRAIILGGSGQGEAVVANRFPGVRASVFYGASVPKTAVDINGGNDTDPFAIIKLSREHDNSNVLSLGARFIGMEDALHAVELWLETAFPGEERHLRRIQKIEQIHG